MRIHLHAAELTPSQVRFSVIVDDDPCGTLRMWPADAIAFRSALERVTLDDDASVVEVTGPFPTTAKVHAR